MTASAVLPVFALLGLLAALASCRAGPEPPAATPAPAPSAGAMPSGSGEPVAMHDHTPRHDGTVGMSGSLHVEALLRGDGKILVWVTNFWRTPLPLESITGTVTVELPSGKQRLPLSVDGDGFAAAGPSVEGEGVDARFELRVGDEPVLIDFYLPVARGTRGAAGVPVAGCRPIGAEVQRGSARLPRCVLPFHREVAAIAGSSAGDRLLIAALDAGVSEWVMPAVDLLFNLAPPPPVELRGSAATPHPEVASAVAFRPDGSEAVVALENRLLRYATGDGSLVRELAPAATAVRDVAWAPDGRALLVATAGEPAAHIVASDDGRPLRSLAVEGEANAVAYAPDGALAAVASSGGAIVLFDATTGDARLRVDTGDQPMHALALAADGASLLLLAGGRDGVLRIWDARTGASRATTPLGRPILHVAMAPHGRVVAVSGERGELALVASTGAALESLRWHGTTVFGLAWAGDVLVSGDEGGRIAVWDLADRLR